MRPSGSGHGSKRRVSGAAADIESKFAQFIDSQDGLDEIMGITLSQRMRTVEPANQVSLSEAPAVVPSASAVPIDSAAAAPSSSPAANIAFASQNSQGGGSALANGNVSSLVTDKAADLLNLSGKQTARPSTPKFKIPKPVLSAVMPAMTNELGVKSKHSVEEVLPIESGSWKERQQGVLKCKLEEQGVLEPEVKEVGSVAFKAKSFLTDARMTLGSPSQIIRDKSAGLFTCLPDEDGRRSFNGIGEDSQMVTEGSETTTEKRRKSKKRKEEEVQTQGVPVHRGRFGMQGKEEEANIKEEKVENESFVTVPESSCEKGDNITKSSLDRQAAGKRTENSQSQGTSLLHSEEVVKKQKEGKKRRGEDQSHLDVLQSLEDGLGRNDAPIHGAVGDEANNQSLSDFCPDKGAQTGPSIIPEQTSMDQSEKETEELHLMMESANQKMSKGKNGLKSRKKKGVRRNLNLTSEEKFHEANVSENPGIEGEVKEEDKVGWETKVNEPNRNGMEINDEGKVGDEANRGDRQQGSQSPVESNREEDVLLFTEIEGDDAGKETTSDETGKKSEKSGQGQQMIETPSIREARETNVFEFDPEEAGASSPRVLKIGEKNANNLAKLMEEVSERAVQTVLEDEMLHVADTTLLPKKSRKDPNPKNWTIRMRGALSKATVGNCPGGFVPTVDACERAGGAVIGPSRTGGPNIRVIETLEGTQTAENLEMTPPSPSIKKTPKKRITTPKKRTPKSTAAAGSLPCPVGCGKLYSGKTSAWYSHKKLCTGASS